MDRKLALVAARTFARAQGHNLGRWTVDGMCECEHCGSALVDADAVAFVSDRDAPRLGTLSYPCPRIPYVYSSSSTTNAA